MRRVTYGGLLLCTVALAESEVLADDAEALQPGVPAYCDYIWGAAKSSASPKIYPHLFLSGGLLSASDSLAESGAVGFGAGVQWRLQAGVSFSLADLNEGLALRDRARTECALYQHQSDLFAFLARYDESDSIAGLEARVAILNDALPIAERILQDQRRLLAHQQATVEELNATTLRVDNLRAELSSGRVRIAAAARKHPGPREPVTILMRSYRRAVAQAAESESRVRLSRRFDLAVRAGYDRLFGVRDNIPLSATLTFTFNLGSLGQAKAEEEAQQGRSGWAAAGVEGIHDRVAILVSRLQAALEVQSRRSTETRVLLADLETRYKSVEKLAGDAVRAYRDYLWFDLIRLKAEDAYLRAQTDELRSLLPPSASTQP